MSQVDYKYRNGATGSFTDIAAGNLAAQGGGSAANPSSRNTSTHDFDHLVWDVAASIGAAPVNSATLVQVAACFTVPSAPTLCSLPQNLQYTSSFGDSHASTAAGPGSMSLQTGFRPPT